MRLSSVVLSTSDLLEDISFSVMDNEPNQRYIIRNMVGIDAEDIIPKFYGFGKETNKKFYEFTMKPREIVMRVAINPVYYINESVSDIRDSVYRIISSNRSGELTLTFKDGAASICFATGYITKMEVAHFTKTPELQITMSCPDPMLRSVISIDIPPGELSSSNPVKITDQPSTAPHGLELKVKFTATTSTFAIQDDLTDPDWKFEVTPASSFLTNDELYISSEFGNKRVFLDRAAGSDIELMNLVLLDSVWPQIFPGLNTFYFPQIANFDWLEFKYRSAYWGV